MVIIPCTHQTPSNPHRNDLCKIITDQIYRKLDGESEELTEDEKTRAVKSMIGLQKGDAATTEEYAWALTWGVIVPYEGNNVDREKFAKAFVQEFKADNSLSDCISLLLSQGVLVYYG